MFAKQTFQDAAGVISRNAKRFISSIRMANAFQDDFAVIFLTKHSLLVFIK